MVATLLKLRLRVLVNTLTRSPWQLVATIIGGLYVLFIVASAVAGLIALGIFAPVSLSRTIVILAGSAVILGWALIPLLLSGIDQTLEPAKLAQYPIRTGTLLLALTATGVLGIPGIATAAVGLASAAVWVRTPVAAVLGVACAAIGVLTAVVASRTAAAVTVGFRSNRRVRELSGILIFIPLMLLAPIMIGVINGLQSSVDALPAIAETLGWTPLGAAWAAPAALASGDVFGAFARLLIAVATLALLLVAWRPALLNALEAPASSTGRTITQGALGILARVPETPAGAVMARCLISWRRDPRYLRQLFIVPLIPILLWFYSLFMGTADLVMWSGPALAFIFALTLVTDISYDGTAFATHVIDGVRGRDDRIGRIAALAVFAVPLTLAVAIGAVAVTGQWVHLPALLGLCIGLLLAGFGVTAVSSARYVIPVPQAGDNPFKATPGGNITASLQAFAVWGILLVLLIPTVVLVVIDFVAAGSVFGWAALGIGTATGVVVLVVGVRLGGALLDRTGPTLLASLRRLRGA